MSPIPFKWTYLAEQLDVDGKDFFFKEFCDLRGDLQKAYEKFDSNNIYAPIAAPVSIGMLPKFAARNNLYLKICGVSNAYLHENLNMAITMKQVTNASGL